MQLLVEPEWQVLNRWLDQRGVMTSSSETRNLPWRTYRTMHNADVLRWCATTSHLSDNFEAIESIAGQCLAFLIKARRADGCVHHVVDGNGAMCSDENDAIVQAHVARALAALSVSELPHAMTQPARDWWRQYADLPQGPLSPDVAAEWLLALCPLAEQEGNWVRDKVRRLSAYLLDECFYPVRTSDWEWFEDRWRPGAALIPAALWAACEVCEHKRLTSVAQVTTRFVVDNVFEEGLLLPIGTQGSWSRTSAKPIFQQVTPEAASIVELLCTAQRASLRPTYGEFAEYAIRWFSGNNLRGERMVDEATGLCARGISEAGVDRYPSVTATVACMNAHATFMQQAVVIEDFVAYSG